MNQFIFQKLKLKNTIFLSNKMLLSLKLLNTNALDLEEEINKIVEENPFLEAEVLTIPNEYRNVRKTDVEDDYIENYELENRSLKTYLIDQFYALEYDEPEEKIFLYLVDLIDQHGFIRSEVKEIAKDLKVPPEKTEKILKMLKSLDPPGIGSKNIQEALKCQTDDKDVITLIDLIEIIQKNPQEALRRSGMSKERFEEALSKIKNLNPYPANGFYESSYTQYVEPDIFITKKDDQYEVFLNDRIDIKFSSLEFYDKLIHSGNQSYIEFAKLKYDQAKNLIEAFLKRKETLLKFGQLIAKKESDFLNGGRSTPLKVSSVAAELGINASTVTRTISSKYVKTPRGIYPLKFFFERFLYKSNHQEISRDDIKEKILNYVSKEDKKCPLSDSKIEEMLMSEGISLSRRVIAKYRDELGIPSSSKRKMA
ncbi:RNA polymerase factor sigma-54 [Athalassotoga sp.]|uniref:RNA polymerase factor sigma-54 n=1 Tax=Athalassotoga sp. TaxID=2022597 RepID=UPI003D06A364